MSGDMHNKYCQVPIQNCKGIHDNGGHCQFDLWGPDRHTSVGNLAFSAYAFRQQQIEDVIAVLANVDDNPNDFLVQQAAFLSVGIDGDSLSDDEITYIEREVSRRLCR